MKEKKSRNVSIIIKNIFIVGSIFIISILIICLAVTPEKLGIGYTSVDNIKVWIPFGWYVETNTEDGFLLNCVESEKEKYSPNFNIMRINYTGDFEQELNRQVDDILSYGIEERSSMTISNYDGRYSKTFHYIMKGDQSRPDMVGDIVFIDEKQGNMLVISFATSRTQYYHFDHLLYKSLGLLRFKS